VRIGERLALEVTGSRGSGAPCSNRRIELLINKFRHTINSEKLKSQGYGLEAIKRLKAGRPIVYNVGKIIVEEHPDGSRFEMTLDEQFEARRVRQLDCRPDVTDL
jgi:hypothetical protein